VGSEMCIRDSPKTPRKDFLILNEKNLLSNKTNEK
jgi:hypothetical protein